MRFPYGPGAGVRGMAENEAHVANIRDTVGERDLRIGPVRV